MGENGENCNSIINDIYTFFKNHMRYHLIPVRMAIINKSTNNKGWQGCGEMRTPTHYWWDCKLMQAPWKTVWRFLQRSKIELPYDPAIPLLGIYPKKSRTLIQKDICISMFITELFTIANLWKQAKYPVNRWVDKEDVVHAMEYYTMEHYSAIKKHEILPCVTA